MAEELYQAISASPAAEGFTALQLREAAAAAAARLKYSKRENR
jgi:hypothetical protein